MSYCSDPENGLVSKQVYGLLELSVIYKPQDLMIINHYRKENISKKEYNKVKDMYSSAYYFDLKIKLIGEAKEYDLNNLNTGSINEIQERINYLNDSFKEDIYIKSGEMIKHPIICHHERTYGASPVKTFVTAFTKFEQLSDSIEVIVKSNLFDNYELVSSFSTHELENLPLIRLSY